MCEKHGTVAGQRRWGFPSGGIDCDTYFFNTAQGTMYLAHADFVREARWWIPIGLQTQQTVSDLTIAFEMNIPKQRNMYVSVHYAIDDDNRVHILHKGKVTVGHGSVSMDEFFRYYRNNPGRWPAINFSVYEYLELGKVSIPITDDEFLGLLESLAAFADYMPGFKDNYRST